MTNEEIKNLAEALNAAGITITNSPQPYAPYSKMELWQQAREAKASMDELEKAYYQALRERDEAIDENQKLKDRALGQKERIAMMEIAIRDHHTKNKELEDQLKEVTDKSLVREILDLLEGMQKKDPDPTGSDLVGRIIEIETFHYRERNQGTIRKYDPCKDRYRVEFCDGEKSWYSRDGFKILPKE